MEDAAYVANGPDRCARCKTALMDALGPAGRRRGRDGGPRGERQRPGRPPPGPGRRGGGRRRASRSSRPASPRTTSGTGRAGSGLRTWDKPAAACLASRLPYGTPVTLGRLAAVEAAEAALHALGFGQLRVRHHGDAARLEVEPDALGEVVARRDEVVAAVRAAGFTFVALDLEGFRSGSLNRALAPAGPMEEER